MNSEAFKSQLEERTQLKLKALGVNLMPDSLWDNTEIFEDSVKEVLGCGEALLSVGWDYSEDLTSLIVFFEVHFLFSEKEINEQLNKLLIPKGEYAWMSPTVSTVRGKEWVKLTIPFAAPQFNEFKQTFFAVLDSELDRRFKLNEGAIFEIFKRQNYNFFAEITDLLEHAFLEALGYRGLPENCLTQVINNSLKIDFKAPKYVDPKVFTERLQLLCENLDGIQFSGAQGNRSDCSVHIACEALQVPGLADNFFSVLKKKLENPELSKIYSE